MADVDDHRAARRQPVARQLEELLRGEVERDVGLAVGVEEDEVVALVRLAQERARVVGVEPQLRTRLQPEVPLPDVEQLAVDLDGVDDRVGEVLRVRARHGAAGHAEHRHLARRRVAERERERQVPVPVVAGQHGVAAPDRVDRLALVELELAAAVRVLDHPRVLVRRLRLVDHASLLRRLDHADREQQQRGDGERRQHPAPAEAERGHEREQDRVDEERALRADERDQQQRGAERPDQRADRRDRVHAARGLTRVLHPLELEPDRPRRHGAEHQHGDRDEREDPEQRAREAADRDVVERVDGQREQRLGDDRDDREQHRRGQHQPAQARQVRVPVGEPAAEPVADRQRHEHDRDRVRPHDRRVAEERRDQPGDRDLRAERRDADDEDEQLERRPGSHGRPSMATLCSVLVGHEVGLAGAADRAVPVGRDVLERGPGRDPAVGIALGGVVDEPARLADPLLDGFGAHAGQPSIGGDGGRPTRARRGAHRRAARRAAPGGDRDRAARRRRSTRGPAAAA